MAQLPQAARQPELCSQKMALFWFNTNHYRNHIRPFARIAELRICYLVSRYSTINFAVEGRSKRCGAYATAKPKRKVRSFEDIHFPHSG